MDSERDVRYRLTLAEGFLGEAEEDVRSSRWRSCVDNAQLAVENANKAAIGRFGPIPRSHNAAALLEELGKRNDLPPGTAPKPPALKALGERLSYEEHIRSDYGEEASYRTPWELFGPAEAAEAIAVAREAVALAPEIVRPQPPPAPWARTGRRRPPSRSAIAPTARLSVTPVPRLPATSLTRSFRLSYSGALPLSASARDRTQAGTVAGMARPRRSPQGAPHAPGHDTVLIALAGLTPQVITETLYALLVRGRYRGRLEVHLLTTAAGRDLALRRLLGPPEGALRRLCREGGIHFALVGLLYRGA
jgi:HEPN domain-containing protein